MLDKHIPDDVPEAAKETLDRTPNYCGECGGELYIYGGRLRPEMGFYEHIDPILQCDEGCTRRRFAMGIAEDGAVGREFRQPAGDHSDIFGGFAGYCDVHSRIMEPTKDLRLGTEDHGRLDMRQYKCPECDLEAVIAEL